MMPRQSVASWQSVVSHDSMVSRQSMASWQSPAFEQSTVSGDAARMRGAGRDRGGISLVVALVAIAISGAALLGVARVGGVLVEANRARTAADAAALAGVLHGRAAADEVAAANGATIVSWHDDGGTVTVTVVVGSASARARATDQP